MVSWTKLRLWKNEEINIYAHTVEYHLGQEKEGNSAACNNMDGAQWAVCQGETS